MMSPIVLLATLLLAGQTPSPTKAPELLGEDWLEKPTGKPPKLADLKGRVVVIHFFASGCINCKRNFPAYGRMQTRFAKDPVTMIGIHTPELPGENDPERLRSLLKQYKVDFPVLRDGGGANWAAWKQEYWPTVYVIDQRGNVRYRWVGELAFRGANGEGEVKRKIQILLDESVGKG